MKKIKNLNLKTQLFLLTAIFATTFLAVGIYLFININSILNSKIESTTEQVFNHVEMEILNYFDNINTASYSIMFNNQIQDYLNNTQDIHSYDLFNNTYILVNSILMNANITSVFLEIKDTRLSYNDISVDLNEVENYEFTSSQVFYTKLFTHSNLGNEIEPKYFAAVRPLFNIRYPLSNKFLGKMIMVLDKSFFDEISSRYGITENSNMYIINNQNEIIGKNKKNTHYGISDAEILYTSQRLLEPSIIKLNNTKYNYNVRKIANTGWKIVNFTPSSEYFSEVNRISLVTFIVFLLVIIITISFSFIITNNITLPIKQLLFTMKNVKHGNLKDRSHVNLDNEIGQLSVYFNSMMEEVYTLTNRIFENQKKLYEFDIANKDARLIALQSQINPHFLYNTLACIHGIALNYKVKEIAMVTNALARMFRYSIKEDNYVFVSSEIENLRNYIMIQKVQTADKINYELDISDDILNCKINKLILQPIVENALIHGLADTIENGILLVKGYRENNNIIFIISDNGCGMPPSTLEVLNHFGSDSKLPSHNIQDNHSIGIANVKQRLVLCYGNNFLYNVKSTPMLGTTVEISIPCMEVSSDD